LIINLHLISTVHREKGVCTSESLFEILNRIKPDVVFCEASQQMFESFKNGLIHSSLEFNSIEELSRHHSFSFVPVESFPSPSLDYRKQEKELFDIINRDEKFLIAYKENDERTHLYGFKYLNSGESIQLFDEMSEREKAVIAQLENPEYEKVYKKRLNLLDNRENIMLENINLYVESNEFENAVFLCGSAHRKAIINKIQTSKNDQLKWSFELP
jgi:hypothetical protein